MGILFLFHLGSAEEETRSECAKRGARSRSERRQKRSGGTHYIKKVSHRFLKIQVLCCFLLLLFFCHMSLEVCFQIFRSERFDNAYAVVVDVDNLITLAVEVVSS